MKKLSASLISGALALSLAGSAFAVEGTVDTSATLKVKAQVDNVCVQTAVDARESSLITAWGTYNTAMTVAYTARKTALHDAWGKTDAKERRAAVKAAWDAFAKVKKVAVRGWNDTRKGVWKTFRTAAKACKGASAEAGLETQGEHMDQ